MLFNLLLFLIEAHCVIGEVRAENLYKIEIIPLTKGISKVWVEMQR
jgi:hypothetical protein